MGDMWRFYWPVVKIMPKVLIKSVHTIEGVVFIASIVICFLSPDYGRKFLHWEAFDPRWGAVPIVLIMIHLFLKEVYENHRDLLQKQTEVQPSIEPTPANFSADLARFAAGLISPSFSDKACEQAKALLCRIPISDPPAELENCRKILGRMADPEHWFDAAVRECITRGMARQEAAIAVARADPELHRAYLLATNPPKNKPLVEQFVERRFRVKKKRPQGGPLRFEEIREDAKALQQIAASLTG